MQGLVNHAETFAHLHETLHRRGIGVGVQFSVPLRMPLSAHHAERPPRYIVRASSSPAHGWASATIYTSGSRAGNRLREWGFKPSAPGREEGESLFGKMGTVTEAKSGLETAAHLTGDRGFESISLQRRVSSEP